jgi:hypothetical protein
VTDGLEDDEFLTMDLFASGQFRRVIRGAKGSVTLNVVRDQHVIEFNVVL